MCEPMEDWSLLPDAGLTPHEDDDDEHFERWLAALSTSAFEHLLDGLLAEHAESSGMAVAPERVG